MVDPENDDLAEAAANIDLNDLVENDDEWEANMQRLLNVMFNREQQKARRPLRRDPGE